MFRTIKAQYVGICRRCNGAIAIGDSIRYGGPGRSYHLAKDCPASGAAPVQAAADGVPQLAATGTDGGTIDGGTFRIVKTRYQPSRRRSYRRDWAHGDDGDSGGGRESFQNPRGRCEDAPCCGCCS